MYYIYGSVGPSLLINYRVYRLYDYGTVYMQILMNVLKVLPAALRCVPTPLVATHALVIWVIAQQVMDEHAMVSQCRVFNRDAFTSCSFS